ncbi:MAG: triose-phosphate isomerase [Bacteroidota bacterium]|nr:triose-phosphate isomerase [Bacteroidota bacterium]
MDLYRTKMVAANWKMNTNLVEGAALINEIIQGLPSDLPCEVVVAPPFTHLPMVKSLTELHSIKVCAQNCHQEAAGAFTGEISTVMLKSMGVEYVIVGHSERRQFFHETHDILKLKVNAILEAGLKPIFCCGEPLEIRQSEAHNIFVRMQLEESLFHLSPEQFKNVCIAYEPIWAIGTGVTASPEQAQEMHAYIRDQIAISYDKILTESTRILYGGSIKPDNAKILFSQEDVDGGLVGGASLSGSGFLEIIRAAC